MVDEQRKGERQMKALWVVLGVLGLIVVVALLVGGSYVSAKNQMVQKDQDVQAAFSQIRCRSAAPGGPDPEPGGDR
jgi:flagellar basal body-associated protein FliL